ncbi:hypothetical protein T310_9962, partial [Rasamsonia emersonii CBS 393.64]
MLAISPPAEGILKGAKNCKRNSQMSIGDKNLSWCELVLKEPEREVRKGNRGIPKYTSGFGILTEWSLYLTIHVQEEKVVPAHGFLVSICNIPPGSLNSFPPDHRVSPWRLRPLSIFCLDSQRRA